MTDHIHDTSAASRPESANLLTHPLREQVARALLGEEADGGAGGYYGRPGALIDAEHAADLTDLVLDVVRAAMPPLDRIASEIEQAADLDRSRVDDIAYEIEAMLLEWLS